MAKLFGATHTFLSSANPVEMIMTQTGGRGVDVAIEALGIQETFENALRVVRPGGTLSSVGVYSGHLRIPLEAFGAGLTDKTIVTTLCPGGKERMARLVRLVQAHRMNLVPLLTHTFNLDEISAAYDLFANRKKEVLKVAIRVALG
jgi:threonine dehydrogenase-like Zn-dependent dehydrogenase